MTIIDDIVLELTASGDGKNVIIAGDGGLEDATDYSPDELEHAMDGDRAFLNGSTIGDKCREAIAHGVSIHEIAEVFCLSKEAKAYLVTPDWAHEDYPSKEPWE